MPDLITEINFNDLPLEKILHSIFNQLIGSSEKKNARLVCQKWNSLILSWFLKFRGILCNETWKSFGEMRHIEFDEVIVDHLFWEINSEPIFNAMNPLHINVKQLTFGSTQYEEDGDHIGHRMMFSRDLNICSLSFRLVLMMCQNTIESLKIYLKPELIEIMNHVKWSEFTFPKLTKVYLSNQLKIDYTISYRLSYSVSTYSLYSKVCDYELALENLSKLNLPNLTTISCLFFVSSVNWEKWKPFFVRMSTFLGAQKSGIEAKLDFFVLPNFIVQAKVKWEPRKLSLSSTSTLHLDNDNDPVISVAVNYQHVTDELCALEGLEYDAIRAISEYLVYEEYLKDTSDLQPEGLHLDELKTFLQETAC